MANGHGGARPNSGPEVGSHQAHTLKKRANRALIRELVEQELRPIIKAQSLNAMGVSYMVVRHEDGTFSRATDVAEIDKALERGEGAFQIFTQQPNQPSAAMLLGYVADKPVEPLEVSGPDGGPIDVLAVLKQRHAKHQPASAE